MEAIEGEKAEQTQRQSVQNWFNVPKREKCHLDQLMMNLSFGSSSFSHEHHSFHFATVVHVVVEDKEDKK